MGINHQTNTFHRAYIILRPINGNNYWILLKFPIKTYLKIFSIYSEEFVGQLTTHHTYITARHLELNILLTIQLEQVIKIYNEK